jgi:excisionase family DNA binding protein
MNKLQTVEQIAKRFGVHPETVRLWVRQNKIPCIRPTERTIRFNVTEVEKAIGKPLIVSQLKKNREGNTR